MRLARSLTSGMYSAPREILPMRPRRAVMKIGLFMSHRFVFKEEVFILAFGRVLNGIVQANTELNKLVPTPYHLRWQLADLRNKEDRKAF